MISAGRMRLLSLLRIAVLTAFAIAFVRIGLVGAHIARLPLSEDHRLLLPGSLLAGAALMSQVSVASKTIVPGVLVQIGIVTALIGMPFFI